MKVMLLTSFIVCIKTKTLQGVMSPGRLPFALRTLKIVEVAQLFLGNSSVTPQAGGEKSTAKARKLMG